MSKSKKDFSEAMSDNRIYEEAKEATAAVYAALKPDAKKPATTRTSFMLRNELREGIRALAAFDQISEAAVINRSIKEYLTMRQEDIDRYKAMKQS